MTNKDTATRPDPDLAPLVAAGYEAANRWTRRQTGWTDPGETTRGEIEAALRHLLDTGMIRLAEQPEPTPAEEKAR
jgi:hypothetical protein